MVFFHLDGKTDKFFYIMKLLLFRVHAKSDGIPRCTSPSSPPDTVDVSFRHVREIELDHVRDVVNVDPAGSTSVATSTRVFPSRKFFKARCRAVCDLFPCMGSALIPFCTSFLTILLAPCFVRENTRTRVRLSHSKMYSKSFCLFFFGTGTTNWSMISTAGFSGDIVTLPGFSRIFFPAARFQAGW